MPRISAPTVAEHRARRRAALLAAARAILTEQGSGALTFPAVASRAGLARTTVYEYFESRADLVGAVVSEDFPVFAENLRRAVDAGRTPRTRLKTYVAYQLEAMAQGDHRLLAEAARMELPEAARRVIMEMHRDLANLLIETLRDMGVRQPDLVASYVQAVVNAATTQIEHGADAKTVLTTACQFTLAAVERVPSLPPAPRGSG